jgi:hypothetical protein
VWFNSDQQQRTVAWTLGPTARTQGEDFQNAVGLAQYGHLNDRATVLAGPSWAQSAIVRLRL